MAILEGGTSGALAEVDPTTKSLHVTNKGISHVTFDGSDFTIGSFERLRTAEARIDFEYTFGAQTTVGATIAASINWKEIA